MDDRNKGEGIEGENVNFLYRTLSLSLTSLESYMLSCMHAKSLQLCPTLQPYGQQPTRLLCPQDSLGKNTGVRMWVAISFSLESHKVSPKSLCQIF